MNKDEILTYLKQHSKEFKNKYSVEKIGIFGSYARGEATKDSDIDIFVKMPPKLFDMVAIKEQIEEELHIKVDLVRLRDKMNPYLKNRIARDGIYV